MVYRHNYQVTDPRERETIDNAPCDYCGADVGEYCTMISRSTRSAPHGVLAMNTHNPRRKLAYKLRKEREEMSVNNKEFADAAYRAMRQREREARMGRKDTLETRLEIILRQAMKVQEQIELLDSLPEEPTTVDPDGALVIWFEKNFTSNGRYYTYAAVKAAGLWYTTGPNSPKAFTWERLTEWMFTNGGLKNGIWRASEFEEL